MTPTSIDPRWNRRELLQAGALAALGLWFGARGARAEGAGKPTAAELTALIGGLNRFSGELYRQLSGQGPNVFFSPASVSPALAMTLAGARGETARQMRAALELGDLPEERLHQVYGHFLRGLASDGDWLLSVANRLWGQQSYQFQQPFLELTRAAYDAELARVDFVGAPEPSRETINAWVTEQTRGMIPDLLPPGSIDSLTRMVLTNAVYFKGNWQERFEESATRDGTFVTAAGQRRECRLMVHKARFPYAETDEAQIVRLPYEGDAISFLAVLPKDPAGLAALEAKLGPQQLQRWRGGLRPRKVQVWLPKFELKTGYSLNEPLQALGMRDAFDFDRADFSGVTTSEKLAITAVIHKAKLIVNEEGSEAAAATGVVLGTRSVEELPVFRADRPFLFAIQDDRSGALLFLGRLGDPAA